MLYYSREDKKRAVLKKCILLNEFMFSRNEFYLLRKDDIFFMCVSDDGDLVMVWKHPVKKDGEEFTAGDVMSIFRKEYVKHGITMDMLNTYLTEPLKYEKKYLKKKPR